VHSQRPGHKVVLVNGTTRLTLALFYFGFALFFAVSAVTAPNTPLLLLAPVVVGLSGLIGVRWLGVQITVLDEQVQVRNVLRTRPDVVGVELDDSLWPFLFGMTPYLVLRDDRRVRVSALLNLRYRSQDKAETQARRLRSVLGLRPERP
jgi:hypothetical protein